MCRARCLTMLDTVFDQQWYVHHAGIKHVVLTTTLGHIEHFFQAHGSASYPNLVALLIGPPLACSASRFRLMRDITRS